MSDASVPDKAAPSAAKTSNLLPLLLALTLTGVVGGGAGALLSIQQVDRIHTVAKKRANATPDKVANALAWSAETAVSRLEPVIANLAQPGDTWIRLDTAIVFDKTLTDDLELAKAKVSEATLAFLRTLTLRDIQGASALNHLRADLNEHARAATDGAVQELIIETMILQ